MLLLLFLRVIIILPQKGLAIYEVGPRQHQWGKDRPWVCWDLGNGFF